MEGQAFLFRSTAAASVILILALATCEALCKVGGGREDSKMLTFYLADAAHAPEVCELQPGPGRWTREGPQACPGVPPSRTQDPQRRPPRESGLRFPPGARLPAIRPGPRGGGVAGPENN